MIFKILSPILNAIVIFFSVTSLLSEFSLPISSKISPTTIFSLFSSLSPEAANAGIQNGDILISVDGVYVNSKIDWNELSKNYLPGSGAGVQVKRGDSFIDTYITFDEK